jgi:hypothetical protein
VCNFLEAVDPNRDEKYKILPSPHKSPECVDLCGIGGVGGLIDPHRVPIVKEKGTLLAKLTFLALKRCVMNMIIFFSRYTRNFSLQYLLRAWIHLEHALSGLVGMKSSLLR